MLDDTQEGSRSGAAIYLDYGADASECDESDFRVCERGLCFKSRWQFAPGTQLAVVVSYPGASGGNERMDAEATVAACEQTSPGCYSVTALFIDMPAVERAALRDMNLSLESRSLLAAPRG